MCVFTILTLAGSVLLLQIGLHMNRFKSYFSEGAGGGGGGGGGGIVLDITGFELGIIL